MVVYEYESFEVYEKCEQISKAHYKVVDSPSLNTQEVYAVTVDKTPA